MSDPEDFGPFAGTDSPMGGLFVAPDAEVGVISAMARHAACIPKVVAKLRADHFYNPLLAKVFEVAVALGSGLTIPALLTRLRSTGILDQAGTDLSICEILKAEPHAA